MLPNSITSRSGFTLVGYATSPLGLGEDLRSFAAMLEHQQIPFSVIDLPTESQGQVANRWNGLTRERYPTFVYFMSPMSCQRLAEMHPELFKWPRQKIGYFLWELPDFPTRFVPALQRMDQIWCPTRFVQQSFFNKVRKLTLALPLPVIQAAPTGVDFRRKLGIPPAAFVSLFLFDVHSTLQRKNPQAAVQAFLRFADQHPQAHLILKVNRLHNAQPGALDWLPRHPRIHLLTDTLAPGELTDLYRSADCYLSLHRSEGFGRTLVEALQNGLELVCTDFSGPQDFVNETNALLVNWKRQTVEPGDYPHAETSWWAQPSVKHAAQRLHEASLRRARGSTNAAGQATGAAFLPQALAERYRPILQAIQTQAGATSPPRQPSHSVVLT